MLIDAVMVKIGKYGDTNIQDKLKRGMQRLEGKAPGASIRPDSVIGARRERRRQ
jgi:hypothetical protein